MVPLCPVIISSNLSKIILLLLAGKSVILVLLSKADSSLALSACVFISQIQSVNRAQILNITFLFLLFGTVAVPVFGTNIVPPTCTYASLKLHKLHFSIEALNLI